MIANVTPPPSGADKMKEYKFYYSGLKLYSDASNPTLYYSSYSSSTGGGQLTPGNAISWDSNKYYAIFAGEDNSYPVIAQYTRVLYRAANGATWSKMRWMCLDENGNIITVDGTGSLSFYLPQS